MSSFIQISNESFQNVPIFPLKNVQLFPQTVLPLHIFEPRYISMVDYALENDHLIVIADTTPTGDQSSSDPSHPAIRPILGAGIIVAKQKIATNRYHILVQGLTRVALLEEHEQTMPFRQIEAEILPDEKVDASELLSVELRLRDLLTHLAEHQEDKAEAVAALSKNAPNGEVLGNMIGANIVSNPTLRQTLFEELNPLRRLEMIYDHVGDLLLNSEFEKEENLYH